MDTNKLKENLMTVLYQIQTDSGLDCPPLSGTTKPIETIPEFDSKIWPIATTILADKTCCHIPNDVNIFVNDKTKLPLSIDEAAFLVCELQKKETKSEATDT